MVKNLKYYLKLAQENGGTTVFDAMEIAELDFRDSDDFGERELYNMYSKLTYYTESIDDCARRLGYW
jgi:hypothetical protein